MNNNYIVNTFNSDGSFMGFKCFELNSSAIQYADQFSKFKIYKNTLNGIQLIENYGF